MTGPAQILAAHFFYLSPLGLQPIGFIIKPEDAKKKKGGGRGSPVLEQCGSHARKLIAAAVCEEIGIAVASFCSKKVAAR